MSFLHGFYRGDHFRRRLKVIESKAPTAHSAGKSECCRSGVCCWRGPCDLSHDDVATVAAHLGLSPSELFGQYLVIDERGGSDRYKLIPRRRQWPGGVYLTSDETYDIDTPCVFLDEAGGNACKIQAVKPKGGREYKCWDPSTHTEDKPRLSIVWSEAQLKGIGWDGNRRDDDND